MCKRLSHRRECVLLPTPKLKVSSAFGPKRRRQLEELSYLRVNGDSPRHNMLLFKFWILGVEDDVHFARPENKLLSKDEMIDSEVRFMESKGDNECWMQFQGRDKVMVGLELFQGGEIMVISAW